MKSSVKSWEISDITIVMMQAGEGKQIFFKCSERERKCSESHMYNRRKIIAVIFLLLHLCSAVQIYEFRIFSLMKVCKAYKIFHDICYTGSVTSGSAIKLSYLYKLRNKEEKEDLKCIRRCTDCAYWYLQRSQRDLLLCSDNDSSAGGSQGWRLPRRKRSYKKWGGSRCRGGGRGWRESWGWGWCNSSKRGSNWSSH